METIGNRIKSRREAMGLSQVALGRLIGVEQPSISNWEKNEHTPPRSRIGKLARALHVSVSWLEYGLHTTESSDKLTQPEKPLTMVPIISWVEAGGFAEVTDPHPVGAAEEFIPLPESRETCIALEVGGESCNREFPPGTIIVVDYASKDLRDKEFYVFRYHDRATLKRYRTNPPRLEPYSTDPDFETIFPEDGFEVVGRIIWKAKKY